MSNTQRPFLKWAGGKYRLVSTLSLHLPKRPTFVEPFVGAGAVFLNIPSRRYILNDINADLICLYQLLQSNPEAVIEKSRRFFTSHGNTKARYYQLRQRFNNSNDALERAALFIYLNRHGFNGLCRFNNSGGFNVPFGRYQKPYFPEKELFAFAQKAQKAHFTCVSFEECMHNAPKRSVIYCDPPYVPLSATANFTGYSGARFGMEAQNSLVSAALAAKERGCTVLISNHDTPQTRALYQHARCLSLHVQRVISCQGGRRKRVKELIAIYD